MASFEAIMAFRYARRVPRMAAASKHMDARLADDDGLKAREIEQIGEGLVAQIEAARIGAEGRQDATARIRGEAAPAQAAGTRRDMRHRVQMAGDLAIHAGRSRARFVTAATAPTWQAGAWSPGNPAGARGS